VSIKTSDKSIRTLSSREVYRNKWTRLREDVIVRAGTRTAAASAGFML
jgi:hypothetical protein